MTTNFDQNEKSNVIKPAEQVAAVGKSMFDEVRPYISEKGTTKTVNDIGRAISAGAAKSYLPDFGLDGHQQGQHPTESLPGNRAKENFAPKDEIPTADALKLIHDQALGKPKGASPSTNGDNSPARPSGDGRNNIEISPPTVSQFQGNRLQSPFEAFPPFNVKPEPKSDRTAPPPAAPKM